MHAAICLMHKRRSLLRQPGLEYERTSGDEAPILESTRAWSHAFYCYPTHDQF